MLRAAVESDADGRDRESGGRADAYRAWEELGRTLGDQVNDR